MHIAWRSGTHSIGIMGKPLDYAIRETIALNYARQAREPVLTWFRLSANSNGCFVEIDEAAVNRGNRRCGFLHVEIPESGR